MGECSEVLGQPKGCSKHGGDLWGSLTMRHKVMDILYLISGDKVGKVPRKWNVMV